MLTPLLRLRTQLPAAGLVLAAVGLLCLASNHAPGGGAGLLPARPAGQPAGDSAADGRARAMLARRPLAFEANRGQADSRHRFLARGPGYQLAVAPTEITLGVSKPAAPGARPAPPAVVRLRLKGANPAARVAGDQRLPGTVNYFLGNDPSKWRTHVPTFQQVRVAGVYPGIDVVHYGSTQDELEHDFLVAPGADPDRIRLAVEGADRVTLDGRGDLVLSLAGGAVRQRKPVAYQEIAGRREPVEAAYVLERGARPEVRLALGEYDRKRSLVIDPTLAYSTYFGGSRTDVAYGLRVDAAGNFCVAGLTDSSNFPVVSPITSQAQGASDLCIVKLDPFGESVLFSTYLGGSGDDVPYAGLQLGPDGSFFVAGITDSTNFPVVSAFQAAHAGGIFDAFLIKIAPEGDRIVFSTYLGGTGSERASTSEAGQPRTGLAVDAAGSAYLVSNTDSNDFPLRNPIQPQRAGRTDLFITKFAPTGNDLVYSTYFGGTGFERGAAAAVDAAGALYAGGYTQSPDFPVRGAAFPFWAGNWDGFAVKFNPDGRDYAYSTFLGGTSSEYMAAAAVDGAGSLYLTGITQSDDFPVAAAFQSTRRGAFDVFLTRLAPAGNALLYSTYIGGSDTDYPIALHLATTGEVTLTGTTASTDFPTQNPIFPNHAGTNTNFDAFFFQMKADGSGPLFSTYFGGRDGEEGSGVVMAGGVLYGAGSTFSRDLPTVNAYDDSLDSGSTDFFLLRITAEPLPAGPTGLTATASGTTVTLNWTDNSNNETGFQVFRKAGNAAFVKLPTGATPGAATFQDSGLAPGTVYTYKVRAVSSAGPSLFSNEAQATTSGMALRLTAPNGGESWTLGSQQNITWTITGGSIASLKIELSTDGGATYPTVIAASAPNNGSFAWAVPDMPTSMARVRVSDVADADVKDESDGNFTIAEVPRTLTLTAPNGGEQWVVTSEQSIAWTSTGKIPHVKLELSTDGGATYPTVIAASAPNNGSFAWAVPDTPTAAARVRVTDAADAAVKDESDGNFSLIAFAIAGRVTLQGTGLTGVTVGVAPGGASATTAADGSYRIEGLEPGTYTVTPTFGGHTFEPASRSVTVGPDQANVDFTAVRVTVPTPPGRLTARARSRSTIELSWTDRSDNEEGFIIERLSGRRFAEIAQVGANATTYTDSGLRRKTRYTYRVRAFNSAGASPPSNTAAARTRSR